MATASIQTAFTAGEISPQLYSRVDLEKFQIGAALIRNFFVDYRGGVTNRPGTKYIDTVLEDSRLIPFVVSTSASYVLVFSNELITIYTAGVFVTTVASPYLATDLQRLNYTQSADVLTLVHPSYPPANLSRTSDTTFSYDVLTTAPTINPPVITTFVAPHSGPYNFGYLVTAVDLDGKEESLPSNPGVKHSEAMNETTNRVIGLSWTAPAEPVSKYNIYKWGPIDAVTLNPATVWGFIGSSQTTTFTDNNIAPDFSKQPPGWGDPFSGGQFQSITVATGGSGYDGVGGDWPNIPYVPLTITGDGTDAAGYAVIDHATGAIIGVFLTNSGKNYTAATVTANGEGGTGATFNFTFSDTEPLNPACTAYLQQRRWFAGADLKPETLVASNVGLYNNFNTTPVSLATDALVISLASEQVNTIRAMVPVSYGMLIFTTGGSFLLNGGSPYAPITPATISVQAQASEGANFLRPLAINYDILYGQAKGNRIRNLAFAWQRQSYTGGDVTQLAPHLFDNFHTTEWAWAEEPFKIVWAVRDDGTMLSLTYVPDQEVNAWARHDTQGLFKSVCSVPEGDTDAVYVIVKRHIPNEDGEPCWVWMLERFAERQSCCIYDSWFLDSALSLPKNFPAASLYVVGGTTIGDTVDLYSYDPCGTPGGNFGISSFVMEARENYTSALATRFTAADFPQIAAADGATMGLSYDHVRRKIMYIGLLSETARPIINTTGFTIWNGLRSIAPGDTITDSGDNTPLVTFTCEKDIDTGAVVFYPNYDAANLVPAGIGGGDGTWRRFTDDFFFSGGNMPNGVNPRTGDFWVSAGSCELYLFRFADNFSLIISPMRPQLGNVNNLVQLVGITGTWVYAQEQNLLSAPSSFDQFYLTPTNITAAETAADELLIYAKYDYPVRSNPTLPLNPASYYRKAVASDGSVYVFSMFQTDTRDYRLYKFTPPSSFVYPTPPIDGGFSDITPWASGTGPNTGAADFTEDNYNEYFGTYKNILFHLPAMDGLAAIAKFMPEDKSGGTQADFSMSCTYVDIGGGTFDHHEAFVGGYMTAAWAVTDDPSLAAFAPTDCREVNPYLDINDFPFDGVDYSIRWLFFIVGRVADGAVVGDPATVIIKYQFTSGAAPAVLQVIAEDGWDAAYATYAAAISDDNVIEASMQLPVSGDEFEQFSNIQDSGIYDSGGNAFWWSGSNPNMYQLDAAFTNRAATGTEQQPFPPFLRLGFQTPIVENDCVHVGCGEITVTEVVNSQHLIGEITASVAELLVPDDPDGAYEPIAAGDWFLSTPTDTITLAHLKGKEVWALADGHVVGPLVANASTGIVTLPFAACTVVAGLKYTQQVKTLYLTMEGLNQGTEQGKRKQISGITTRVDCTLGPVIGSDFELMYSPPEFATTVNDPASNTVLATGDVRALNFPQWDTKGEVCVEQTLPLPASILGIIVEVTPGDTGR